MNAKASDIGAGLIANFLTAGLRVLAIEVQRRNRVFYAITGQLERPSERIIKKAYSDITQTLGRAGRVDTDVHAFLQALGRSELVEPLALAAFADIDWRPLQYPIYLTYVGAIQDESNALSFERCKKLTEDIFRGMREHLNYPDISRQLSLLTSSMDEVKKSAARRVQNARKSWALHDDSQNLVLTPSLVKEKRPWLFLDPQRLDDLVKEISKAIREAHSKLIVAKPDRQRAQLAFADVYVPSKVELGLGGSAEYQRADIVEQAIDYSLRFPRTIILGNPGGGKSTIAQGYCLSLARHGEVSGDRFPIMLRVREMYATMRHNTSISVLDFLIQRIAKVSEHYQPNELREPIKNLLSNGRCICIFDGLDEVITVDERADLVNQVQRFMSQWSRCSFFVTSRPQGYAEAPLDDIFQQLRLLPFSENEVGDYFEKISQTVFDVANKEEIKRQKQRFIAEVKRNAPDLCQTPLLLSLIIWLFHSTSRIPDNRLEVYEQCAKLLFVEWDRARQINARVLEEHRLLQLLPFLASKIFVDPDLTNSFGRKWLKRRVVKFFDNVLGDSDGGRSEEAADQFVSHLSGRAWVLTEIETGEFEFTHRSFLEYFFAKHLDEEHESVGELIAALAPHLKDREWTVPAHIAVQLKADRGIRSAHRCAAALSKEIENASKDRRPNLVLFAAEACEYLQPPDRMIREISSAVVRNANSESYWATAFLSLVQVQTPLRDAVYGGVAEGLIGLLSTHFAKKLSPTLDWLLSLKLSSRGHISPVQMPWLDRSPDAFDRIATAVAEQANLDQITLPITAKALFDLTDQIASDRPELYGQNLWRTTTAAGRRDWRLVDLCLMRNDLIKILHGRLSLSAAPYANLAVLLFKSVDPKTPEMAQTFPTVSAAIPLEKFGALDPSDCDPYLTNVLSYVNRGILDYADALDMVIYMPNQLDTEPVDLAQRPWVLDGPIWEEPVFTLMGIGQRASVTPRQILESYGR